MGSKRLARGAANFYMSGHVHEGVRSLSHASVDSHQTVSLDLDILGALRELDALPLSELRIRVRICELASRLLRRSPRGAAQSVAMVLGVAPTTLQRWAQVSRCFDRQSIDSLCARRDQKGRRITFWHLVELARVSQAKRARLVELVFAESLSVAQLRNHVRAIRTAKR
jgi:hypothetical protein